MPMTGSKQHPTLALFINGPLYHFYLWTRLVIPPLLLYKRRMIIIALLAWLPLLFFSVFEHLAAAGVKVTFIRDVDTHVRFLISLPLLIYAEVIANERLSSIVDTFLQNNLIAKQSQNKFKALIASTMQLTNSWMVEIFLLLFVILCGYSISKQYLPFEISTWYASMVNNIPQLTISGYWYALISLPIFQFILLRWYYRLFLWYRFLWKTSRLNLELNSLHPDRAGGLGFLINSLYGLLPFLLAHTFLITAMIFNRMWNAHAQFMQFEYEIISLMILLILLPFIPLLFFMFALAETKRQGTLSYNSVAQIYVNNFWNKWITNKKSSEKILGTPDIQSLADLANSYEVSANMRITPFSWHNIVTIGILTALPLLPLLVLVIPVDKIIHQTIRLLF